MFEKSKTRIKISFVLNIIIFVLTAIALFIALTGIKFSKGVEPIFVDSVLGIFKYFTVESNIFMGIVALVFALEEYKLLKNDNYTISNKLFRIKFIATVAVGVTISVVFVYLGPIVSGGIHSLLMNSNLFFHLFIPILSILTFVFVERTNRFKFKDTLYGLIPVALYAVFYSISVISHIENGAVSSQYDWYHFVQDDLSKIFIIPPIMFSINYIVSLIVWRGNKTK